MSRSRLALGACIALLLAACGSSHVIRTAPAPARVSVPKYGESAVVRAGDTLYHIATTHGISVLDLAVWNDIAPPYTIHPGERLRLYPRERNVAERAPVPRPTAPAQRPRSTGAPMAKPAVAAATTPSVSATPATPAAPVAPPASNLAWRWPAEGALVGRYADGDPTSQGIDIGGRSGQPVLAAADGVVVYSGSGLVGYGELVIIKHNDSWLSAYGHNRARLVNEGQLVKAGQQIAEMGHTGAARDMLHFEIRYNGKPVDPLQYLPQR
ncbi:MAG: peptidoglycan DD-metalloendopeptidase family protein [Lysobacter sp.]|nr:peptidoglycan DD-metalloendopeptidase family protein [Lysobacter sp.]